MQNNEMVEKKRVKFDGVEVAGLVSVAEITREKSTVDVPSFRKIRKVQSDITRLPDLTLVYKVERNTDTLDFFDDFFDNNRVADVEILRTDAHGVTFGKPKIYTGCEGITMTEPAYDAASPDFAKVTIILAPEDIV